MYMYLYPTVVPRLEGRRYLDDSEKQALEYILELSTTVRAQP